MIRRFASLVLLCVLIAGCGAPRAAVRHQAKPSPTPAPSASPTIGPLAAPVIHWTSCSPAGWQCGQVAVPLDYTDPSGPKVEIAVNRHKATNPAQRVGSLLVNPGGPGISGVQFAVNNFSSWSALSPYFDIVGFDPRGVGQSEPVKCFDDSQLDAFFSADAWPDDPGEMQTLIQEAQQFVAGCKARSGAVLGHVDTETAARDLDQIRAGLGDPKLTYLGYSYGTFLGQMYAHLFPTHVRALALDGVLDPKIDETALLTVQAAGFERDLDDYLAACKPSTCPYSGSNAKAELEAAMEKIDRSPLSVNGRIVNSTIAETGILLTLYLTPSEGWPLLTQGLRREQAGDGSTLLRYADFYFERDANGHYSNSIEANNAINCLDHPLPSDPNYLANRAPQLVQQAPFFGPLIAYSDLPCRYWPSYPTVRRPSELDDPGAPPIVLIGSTADPATPYSWAQAVHAEIPTSVLLTRTGDGHTSYDVSSCIRSFVNPYLIALTVPPEGENCPTD